MGRYVGKPLSFTMYSVINPSSSSVCFDKNRHHKEACLTKNTKYNCWYYKTVSVSFIDV